MTDVVFITKFRELEVWDENTDDYSIQKYNSGVYLSAKFLSDMLNQQGISSSLEKAIDNNCIDRIITETKAKIVIIEAYWVVPEKFEELLPLHPNTIFIIRNHSAMPFISEEGIIIDWTMKYLNYKNVYVGFNHKRTYEEFKYLASLQKTDNKILYLPNYYPIELIKKDKKRKLFSNDTDVHIGCFGALRPLKNNLTQAYAAIKFADDIGRKLYFHINVNRLEQNISPTLKNIQSLFDNTPNAELVINEWMSHEDFYKKCGEMDIGLQVSFSETFNIVAADLVAQGIPVVASSEIDFISKLNQADMNKTDDIVKVLKRIKNFNKQISYFCDSRNLLERKVKDSIHDWKKIIYKFLKG